MDQDEKLEEQRHYSGHNRQKLIHKCRSILRDSKTTWGQFVVSKSQGLRTLQFGCFELEANFTSHLKRHCNHRIPLGMRLDPTPNKINEDEFFDHLVVPDDET